MWIIPPKRTNEMIKLTVISQSGKRSGLEIPWFGAKATPPEARSPISIRIAEARSKSCEIQNEDQQQMPKKGTATTDKGKDNGQNKWKDH